MIPKKIIDNSDVTLSAFLNSILTEIPNTSFDISTAFFNLQAYSYVKDNIQGVKRFRLLLGKAPEIRNDDTLIRTGKNFSKIFRMFLKASLR